MSDLETAVRAALRQYRERHRQMPIPAADDEAVTAIMAACRAETDRAVGRERAEFGRQVAARPRTPPRRTSTARSKP